MRDVMFLLAVYGAVLVWRKNYLPWIALVGKRFSEPTMQRDRALDEVWEAALQDADVAKDEPPLGRWLVRTLRSSVDIGMIESTKPWSCPLCMSFLFGLPLYPLTFSAWTMPVVAAFAAIGAWSLLDGLDGYFRVVSGSGS